MRKILVYSIGLLSLGLPAPSMAGLECDRPGLDRLADAKGLQALCEETVGPDDRIQKLPDGVVEVVVCADRRWNPTKVEIEPDEHYRFTLVAREDWRDWSIPATANGWNDDRRSWFIDTFGSWAKRYAGADWYALTASLGLEGEAAMAEVGAQTSCVASASDELYFFANDAWWFYWNNHGAVKVRIEKLDDSG